MEYISVKEAAEKWGVVARRVQYYCANDKVPGAKNMGKQWLIPADAKKPSDGRTKQGKSEKIQKDYLFPVMVFISDLKTLDTLPPEASTLFQAELSFLKGNLYDAIIQSKKVIKTSKTTWISFGAYATLGFSSMMLGLISEYDMAVASMKKIIENETSHKADYLLVYSFLTQHLNWNPNRVLKTDISNISKEALEFCQYALMMTAVLQIQKPDEITLSFYESLEKSLGSRDNTTASAFISFILFVLFDRMGFSEKSLFYMKKAVNVSVKNEYYYIIAKFCVQDHKQILPELSTYGKRITNKVSVLYNQMIINWNIIHKSLCGQYPIGGCTPDEYEYMVFFAHNFTMKNIANLKNISIEKTKEIADNLCLKYNLKNPEELSGFSKNLLEQLYDNYLL